MNTEILKVVSGSQAYNLAVEGSDLDIRSVFAFSKATYLGFTAPKDTIQTHSKNIDGSLICRKRSTS